MKDTTGTTTTSWTAVGKKDTWILGFKPLTKCHCQYSTDAQQRLKLKTIVVPKRKLMNLPKLILLFSLAFLSNFCVQNVNACLVSMLKCK